jgi:hypothetical protein
MADISSITISLYDGAVINGYVINEMGSSVQISVAWTDMWGINMISTKNINHWRNIFYVIIGQKLFCYMNGNFGQVPAILANQIISSMPTEYDEEEFVQAL